MLRSRIEVDVDDVDIDVDVLFTVPSVVVIDVFVSSWTGTGTTVGVEESALAALASEVPPPARGKKPRQHSALRVASVNTNRTFLCTEIDKPLKHTMTSTHFQQSQPRPSTPIPTESLSARDLRSLW